MHMGPEALSSRGAERREPEFTPRGTLSYSSSASNASYQKTRWGKLALAQLADDSLILLHILFLNRVLRVLN